MSKVGFYAIHTSRIRFGRDGIWYADDEPIANRRIRELFARHLQRAHDGGYEICMAGEHAPVEVDDTPFVITSIEIGSRSVCLHLNDLSSEDLDPHTLEVGRDNVLYCRVKEGRERARFLRTSYYQMATLLELDGTCVRARIGGKCVPVAVRDA